MSPMPAWMCACALVLCAVAACSRADPPTGAPPPTPRTRSPAASSGPVAARPRLAAVIGRGEASIENLRTEVAGALAWVVAVYRWTAQAGRIVELGRATLVLEREEAGWRIRHVHSSTVPPW